MTQAMQVLLAVLGSVEGMAIVARSVRQVMVRWRRAAGPGQRA